MSRPSHSTPDTLTQYGWHHGDRFGSVHAGKSSSCELCKVDRMRAMRAWEAQHAETVKNAPAVTPRVAMSDEETATVRAVNLLLRRKKPAAWPWILGGVACALGIWCLAVYGAICLLTR